MTTTFIGIDLAWSRRNASGVAALRLTENTLCLDQASLLSRDGEILAFVAAYLPSATLLVAMDAPTCVPNATGRRACDAEVSAAFGAIGAGALPANRTLLLRYGEDIRGETLVNDFAQLGIRHDPHLEQKQPTQQAFEVYPHPAMIRLFGLARALRYKRKPHQPRSEQQTAWLAYAAGLRNLSAADPALVLSAQVLDAAWSKANEDIRDAILCAYIAAHYWWHGMNFWQVYGSAEGGHIVAPRA